MRTQLRAPVSAGGWARLAVVCTLLLPGGCLSTGLRPPRIPRFEEGLPSPVVIQVLDRRPPSDIGKEPSEDWIYYTNKTENHAEALGRLLGTALVSMEASPRYSYVGPSFSMEEGARFGIRVLYQRGYARWPVEPNQNRDRVPVEGACKLEVELWRNGKRVSTLRASGRTPPFPVPVSIIHRGNVRQVVGDSLIHQYNKSVEDTLDVLLPRMADQWESFRKGEGRGATSRHPAGPRR